MFNSKIKNYLVRLVNSKSCPRAYIFAGQGGNEKEEAVFYFISRIAGKVDNAEFMNRVKAKNHPDVVIIEPEIEEKKGKTREKEIGIPQIREALERIKFFPYELKKKFCVIKKAQKMNAEAANALLKHFEEPSESAVFILLADETESILPTIVSRCAVIRFPQTELPKWDEENRAQFKKMFQQKIFERFDYIEKISKNKNEMIAELKDWELVAAEGLRKLIKKSEDRKKIEKVVDLIENIKEAIARLEYTNASARAVGEELVLNF
jgi:DNA polymerase III delta prime subunit